jgi:hypothetical protein
MFTPAYELHLTVRAEDDGALARFREFCAASGVGCTVVELARGESRRQPMTSSRHVGSLEEVRAEALVLSGVLEAAGFPVVRVKLEAHPENACAPATDAEARKQPEGRYFEHHVKVVLPPEGGLERLVATCEPHGAHVSSTTRRVRADGGREHFVTARHPGVGRATALERCQALVHALVAADFEVVSAKSEYTVVDTHAGLDRGWLPS